MWLVQQISTGKYRYRNRLQVRQYTASTRLAVRYPTRGAALAQCGADERVVYRPLQHKDLQLTANPPTLLELSRRTPT